VGGEVYFDESYDGNPLVNALSLGVLRHDQIKRGKAAGVGNPVIYVGSATGRDGLAGAAFASRELTEESQQDRPAVQVGDPFNRKSCLLEACLEVMRTDGLVVGIQDMGAAGLTCSTCETASRGGAGNEIDLKPGAETRNGHDAVRDPASESQERMLLIAQKGREKEVEAIFEKWDLHGVTIGRVTDDGMMRVKVAALSRRRFRQAYSPKIADLPSRSETTGVGIPKCEVRNRSIIEPGNYQDVLFKLLAHRRLRPRTGCIANTITWCRMGTVCGRLAATRRWFASTYRGPRPRRGGRNGREVHRIRDGLQFDVLLPRPVRGRQDCRGGSRAQPGLQRCTALGHHRQPQLRQPMKPEAFLAISPLRRRHLRSMQRV